MNLSQNNPDHNELTDVSNFENIGAPQPTGNSLFKKIMWIACSLIGVALLCGFAMLIHEARMAAWMSTSKNNLRQLGLALHNYHDTHRVLPPSGVFDFEVNKSRQSWMTALLPFIDSNPHTWQLHEAGEENKPWNHPDLHKIFSLELPPFMNPAINHPYVDGYGAAHYSGNSHLFFRNSSVRFKDITDGSANTIMGGEISAGFMAWANPENVRDPANGINKGANSFGSPFSSEGKAGAQMLFADGRVKFISEDIDPDILKKMSTPAD